MPRKAVCVSGPSLAAIGAKPSTLIGFTQVETPKLSRKRKEPPVASDNNQGIPSKRQRAPCRYFLRSREKQITPETAPSPKVLFSPASFEKIKEELKRQTQNRAKRDEISKLDELQQSLTKLVDLWSSKLPMSFIPVLRNNLSEYENEKEPKLNYPHGVPPREGIKRSKYTKHYKDYLCSIALLNSARLP